MKANYLYALLSPARGAGAVLRGRSSKPMDVLVMLVNAMVYMPTIALSKPVSHFCLESTL